MKCRRLSKRTFSTCDIESRHVFVAPFDFLETVFGNLSSVRQGTSHIVHQCQQVVHGSPALLFLFNKGCSGGELELQFAPTIRSVEDFKDGGCSQLPSRLARKKRNRSVKAFQSQVQPRMARCGLLVAVPQKTQFRFVLRPQGCEIKHQRVLHRDVP